MVNHHFSAQPHLVSFPNQTGKRLWKLFNLVYNRLFSLTSWWYFCHYFKGKENFLGISKFLLNFSVLFYFHQNYFELEFLAISEFKVLTHVRRDRLCQFWRLRRVWSRTLHFRFARNSEFSIFTGLEIYLKYLILML